MSAKDIITSYLSGGINNMLSGLSEDFFEKLYEIRLRADRPLILNGENEYFISLNGTPSKKSDNPYKPSLTDISVTLELISRHSIYAYEDELKNGYLTLPGGHRVGVAGKTVIENGTVKTIRNINGLNIRISHEIKGCADKLIKYIALPKLKHTLIISPPGCGKTTLLRDIIRLLSDGVDGSFTGKNVGLVDERSEIAGCYNSIPQNDVGIRTDVLDGCPKADGMLMLLRSMSPEVIAVDEIGSAEDIKAIEYIINAGIKLICTVHGKNAGDLRRKPLLDKLLNDNIFETVIILSGKGRVDEVVECGAKYA